MEVFGANVRWNTAASQTSYQVNSYTNDNDTFTIFTIESRDKSFSVRKCSMLTVNVHLTLLIAFKSVLSSYFLSCYMNLLNSNVKVFR